MPSVITPCGGGGGGGIQFDTTPQSGTFLQITTSTYMNLETEGSQALNIDALGTGDINLYAATGLINIAGQEGVAIASRGDSGIILDSHADGDIVLVASGGTSSIKLQAFASSGHYIILKGLPVTDPGISGALWNDGGTLKIS